MQTVYVPVNEDDQFDGSYTSNDGQSLCRLKETEAFLLSKEDADRVVNELTKIRNELYECVPTGEVKAFELISLLSAHLRRLDAFIDSLNKSK